MKMTNRQLQVMTLLCRGNPDGSVLDIDQLLESLVVHYGWVTSKASMHCTLRPMLEEGYVIRDGKEIRRSRSRSLLKPTDLGFRLMGIEPLEPA